jgi:hypothetical protein
LGLPSKINDIIFGSTTILVHPQNSAKIDYYNSNIFKWNSIIEKCSRIFHQPSHVKKIHRFGAFTIFNKGFITEKTYFCVGSAWEGWEGWGGLFAQAGWP